MNQTHLPIRTARGRLGGLLEAMESPIQSGFYWHLRSLLWRRVSALPGPIVGIGSGHGQNFPYHPPGEVLATDIDADKLARASCARGSGTHLAIMDAERLALTDGSFGVAVGTFVFAPCPILWPVFASCSASYDRRGVCCCWSTYFLSGSRRGRCGTLSIYWPAGSSGPTSTGRPSRTSFRPGFESRT